VGSEPVVVEADATPRWLSRGVRSVALASFCSDSGHEIATAVLPSFLTATLHAGAGSLGLIEGLSDALSGVMKLFGGSLANDRERRSQLARGGYLATLVAMGAIGLAGTVWQAGFARAVAWSARGLRSPARDSLLASLAPARAYGRAFGLERAGDNLGAVVGPLLAAGLISWVGIRPTLYLSAVPGLFAAFAITVAAGEARRQRRDPERRRVRVELKALHRAGALRPMLPIGMFEFGNVATTLLILRATNLLEHQSRTFMAAATVAILIYAGHNLVGSVVAYAGGHWLDRSRARIVFALGAGLYVLAYLGFACGSTTWLLAVAFLLAGGGIGLAETAESTLVARMLPDQLRSSGFGLLGGLQSAGDLASSGAVGLLWTVVSARAAFLYAVGWMALALLSSLTPRWMP
jgi:MFS family permease